MNCPNCQIRNDINCNYCQKCGIKLDKIQKCPICLVDKKLEIFGCGHQSCLECINKLKNNKCPICRKKFMKCNNCSTFRVKISKNNIKCLSCNYTKIITGTKNKLILSCPSCTSNNISFENGKWNCGNCYFIFKGHNSNSHSNKNLKKKIKICGICNSSNINKYGDNYNCEDCSQKNIEVKLVSLDEFSQMEIKERKRECPTCNQRKITDILNTEDYLVKKPFCNICKTFIKPIYIH